jgi:hypothetical protein
MESGIIPWDEKLIFKTTLRTESTPPLWMVTAPKK